MHKYSHSHPWDNFSDYLCFFTNKGIEVIRSGGSAVDAAVEAMKILENSPLTNAGM